MERYIFVVFPMLISLAVTAITLRFLIPVLKSHKMGQKILDIGPRWHKDKEGTPTMGGVSFLLSVLLITLGFFAVLRLVVFSDSELLDSVFPEFNFTGALITVIYAVLSGIIGMTDDLRKLQRKQNEGLTAPQKFLLQLIISVAFVAVLRFTDSTDTVLYVPFFKAYVDFGWLWYLFVILFLTGFGNAVNLTDGIDGLCGAVSAVVALYFTAFSLYVGDTATGVVSSALLGGCIGFLIYNLHPAKVFMGDTGSLFLGALISGLAIISDSALILFLVGIVYVAEAASVIIQVVVFKLTGKRVFLMAPLHHHFEKKGISEGKITLFSALLTAAVSVLAFVFG